jgi:hypothetical protein
MPGESPIEHMLREWKEAEQRAREAELLLYRAYADFASGKGPGPSEQEKVQATELRLLARAAYQTAMAAVDRVLDEADRKSRGF